jgi:Family of unknown function (DUF5681)
MAENAAPKQRRRGTGRPFEPGKSGNPAGKPKGARHAVTMLAERLLDGDAERLVGKAIELGLAGDVATLRLLLDRIIPPRRDRPVAFSMPPLSCPGDAAASMAALVSAVADGNLTPGEASELSALIGTFIKVFEATEIERRLRALEERLAGEGQ